MSWDYNKIMANTWLSSSLCIVGRLGSSDSFG